MGKKKKFIDKKNAVTFRLCYRSQKDPLITDVEAPYHVLQEVSKNKSKEKVEPLKYGIYLDDGYDYMQHLKPIEGEAELVDVTLHPKELKKKKPTSGLNLPSSVFPSFIEEKVGCLNKAAPVTGLQLHLDPDVVAGLCGDYKCGDPNNFGDFEDDFVALGGGVDDGRKDKRTYDDFFNEDGIYESPDNESEGPDDEYEGPDDEYEDTDEEMEKHDEVESLENFDTKSRFTSYSMSSSVIRRNEQLTMLDDKFEEMFAGYDENEIGALDCEEIEGDVEPESNVLESCVEEYEKYAKPGQLPTENLKNYINLPSESSESETELIEIKEKEKWDCESILSTYSTLYNHPKLISAPKGKIRVNPRTGIPMSDESRLTAKALASLPGADKVAHGPGSLASAVSTLSIRPKDETPADRRSRKTSFKEHKRERRIERKLNTTAFKEEKKRMEKTRLNHNVSKAIIVHNL